MIFRTSQGGICDLVPWGVYIFSHAPSHVSFFSQKLSLITISMYTLSQRKTWDNMPIVAFLFFFNNHYNHNHDHNHDHNHNHFPFFFHSPLFVLLVFWVLGRNPSEAFLQFQVAREMQEVMISADPKEMFGALKHFCLEDFLFARSVFWGFFVLMLGVGWCLEMGKTNARAGGFGGFGLLDVSFFLVGMRFLGLPRKKEMDVCRKKVRMFRCDFLGGRFWRMIPGRCCQAGWHLK